MAQEITLAIVTPQKILFEGTVTHAQIPARDGYMGFLPRHAPLVSPLGTGIVSFTDESGSSLFFAVSGGYFEIHSDKMVLLADVAEAAQDIDPERAREAMERAENRINGATPGTWDLERAEAAMRRALNRLRAADMIK